MPEFKFSGIFVSFMKSSWTISTAFSEGMALTRQGNVYMQIKLFKFKLFGVWNELYINI